MVNVTRGACPEFFLSSNLTKQKFKRVNNIQSANSNGKIIQNSFRRLNEKISKETYRSKRIWPIKSTQKRKFLWEPEDQIFLLV